MDYSSWLSIAPSVPDMLALLERWVKHESPSREKSALDVLGREISAHFGDLGGRVERIPNDRGGDHWRITWNADSLEGLADPRPVLLMGHFDTVWPLGILERMPWRTDHAADRAYGPGVYDMKSGLVFIASALETLRRVGVLGQRPIVVLLTSDEEIGSPTSRQWIEAAARDAAFALVPEPPLADGSWKSARKGVGQYTLTVRGRAAHAGIAPERGVNAIEELARQILSISALQNPKLGTTLNVGVIRGGTTHNVVPDLAEAVIDARTVTMEEAQRIDHALRTLTPNHPEAGLSWEGGWNRPPMERAVSAGLLEQAVRLAKRIGITASDGSTGGGSDGNFASAAGCPTLDGLGACGDGAHALHEQIVISSMHDRMVLLAVLIAGLT